MYIRIYITYKHIVYHSIISWYIVNIFKFQLLQDWTAGWRNHAAQFIFFFHLPTCSGNCFNRFRESMANSSVNCCCRKTWNRRKRRRPRHRAIRSRSGDFPMAMFLIANAERVVTVSQDEKWTCISSCSSCVLLNIEDIPIELRIILLHQQVPQLPSTWVHWLAIHQFLQLQALESRMNSWKVSYTGMIIQHHRLPIICPRIRTLP